MSNRAPVAGWRVGRPTRRVVALVCLVIALLVLVDIGVTVVAQRRVQAVVSSALPGAQVSTSVGGPPVLAHLAFDQLGTVTLDARDVVLPDGALNMRVAELRASAHGVRGVQSSDGFRLDRVSGTVRLEWTELSRVVGVDLVRVGDTVRVAGTVPVLGDQLDGTLEGQLSLDPASQQIVLLEPAGTLDGVVVPSDILSGLVSRLSARLRLPSVPGLVWTKISADDQGAVLSFRGENLVFGA